MVAACLGKELGVGSGEIGNDTGVAGLSAQRDRSAPQFAQLVAELRRSSGMEPLHMGQDVIGISCPDRLGIGAPFGSPSPLLTSEQNLSQGSLRQAKTPACQEAGDEHWGSGQRAVGATARANRGDGRLGRGPNAPTSPVAGLEPRKHRLSKEGPDGASFFKVRVDIGIRQQGGPGW